jgi:phosphoribosyl-ATP pyrophosphohydrolase/phosphoribosyl-AMP cyclohydrolase
MNEKLIPLIVQDASTKQVLSLFYCNEESVRLMAQTGFVWRYSRSKGMQMRKGDTSGNLQKVRELLYDCDNDAVLAIVDQQGEGACHTGTWSCFTARKMRPWGVLDELCGVIAKRKSEPKAGAYTSQLVQSPRQLAEKLTEEAGELGEALLEKPDAEVVWEAADLLYFTLVALENRGIDAEKVLEELKRRRK